MQRIQRKHRTREAVPDRIPVVTTFEGLGTFQRRVMKMAARKTSPACVGEAVTVAQESKGGRSQEEKAPNESDPVVDRSGSDVLGGTNKENAIAIVDWI
jgi:hypothetical protein